MSINLTQASSFLTSVAAFITAVKLFYNKYEPIVRPLIEAAEEEYKKDIADGKIDVIDRKAIVMAGVAKAEANGTIKLNVVSRWVLGKVVDKIAEALPDIVVSINETPKP